MDFARLNANGTLDAAFVLPGPDAHLGNNTGFTVQADGKILIGGFFFNYNGTPRPQIARINADGSLDTGFLPATPYPGLQIRALALQPNGKVLVGVDVAGSSVLDLRNRIVRLNADGSLDTSFLQDGAGFETINAVANGTKVHALLLQPDDALVVGGDFDSVDGVARLALARLLGATPPACPGDCNRSGAVTVDELIALVNIALGTALPAVCPHGIPPDTAVDITLIIQAVNVALTSCPTERGVR
jgi:uncharacterized delta-60 repeat protein